MSVVIIGGNECMTRRYIELCNEYNCKAKVFPKKASELKNIGRPDLLILFTNTVSHKMVRCALSEVKTDTPTAKARWVLMYIHFQIYSKAYKTNEFP